MDLIHLESLIVGEGSLMNASEIEMRDGVDVEWIYEATDMMSLLNAPPLITKLMIADNCCNEFNFTSLDLSRFINLQSLNIGRHSLVNVRSVTALSPIPLHSFIVGMGSLIQVNAIDISSMRVVDWVYEASDMMSLLNGPVGISKLVISDNSCNELNFTSLDLSRFDYLESLVIGDNSLNHIVTITGLRPELLNEVLIGENSLSELNYP